MQNRTENSPVIPPVKQGRALEYAAGIGNLNNFSKEGKAKQVTLMTC